MCPACGATYPIIAGIPRFVEQQHLASFGLQRDIVAKDRPWLSQLASLSHDAGSTEQLVLALIQTDAFRVHGGEP